MNPGRIRAIFFKELLDLPRNPGLLALYLLPALITLMIARLPGDPDAFALRLGLMMLICLAGTQGTSVLVAEEKEKKTLEVLLLSPARPWEILAGKGLLTFLLIMAFSMLQVFFINGPSAHWPLLLCGTALMTLTCITLGMAVGLLAPNQMTAGILNIPLYLVLAMVPIFAQAGGKTLGIISKALPSTHYFNLLDSAFGETQRAAGAELPALAGGLIVSFIILSAVFRRVKWEK